MEPPLQGIQALPCWDILSGHVTGLDRSGGDIRDRAKANGLNSGMTSDMGAADRKCALGSGVRVPGMTPLRK